MTTAAQAAAAMRREAARLEAEPAEDRLSVLEARVAMLTEAVAALVRDRDDDDDDEEGY
jgi:hypothetical protein